MIGTHERSNVKNISSSYSDVVFTYGEYIHPHAKDAAFSRICDIPQETNIPKWSCVLNFCSGCPAPPPDA